MTREIACNPDSGGYNSSRIQARQVCAVGPRGRTKILQNRIKKFVKDAVALGIGRVHTNGAVGMAQA